MPGGHKGGLGEEFSHEHYPLPAETGAEHFFAVLSGTLFAHTFHLTFYNA
jgi:hypothetical protein